MPKVQYREQKFRGSSLAMIDRANAIIEEYEAQGYTLTLRQLYYQLVARDVIPNKQTEYNRPTFIDALITETVESYMDHDAMARVRARETRDLASLEKLSDNWQAVSGFLGGLR